MVCRPSVIVMDDAANETGPGQGRCCCKHKGKGEKPSKTRHGNLLSAEALYRKPAYIKENREGKMPSLIENSRYLEFELDAKPGIKRTLVARIGVFIDG